MNLTIGKINNSWQRFKVQYIAAACGLAIAVSAVLASTPWDSSPSVVAPAIGGAGTQLGTPAGANNGANGTRLIQTSPVTAQPAQGYIYVVSSEQEASELRATLASASQEDLTGTTRSVLVVGSDEADTYLGMMLADLAASGNDTFDVVDLR